MTMSVHVSFQTRILAEQMNTSENLRRIFRCLKIYLETDKRHTCFLLFQPLAQEG